jgi:hypothetical protein
MKEIINQILAKEFLSDSDINILMKNKNLLSQDVLVRLGFVTAPVKELEVVAKTEKTVETPVVSVAKVSRKKKLV